MNTSPRPHRYAMQCYDLMDTMLDSDDSVCLSDLMGRYMCLCCPKDHKDKCGLPFEWVCTTVSEALDCHGGFMPFPLHVI